MIIDVVALERDLSPLWQGRVRRVAMALQTLAAEHGAPNGFATSEVTRNCRSELAKPTAAGTEFRHLKTGDVGRVGRFMTRFIQSVECDGKRYRVGYEKGRWSLEEIG